MRHKILVWSLVLAPFLWAASWVEPQYHQSISDDEIAATVQKLRTEALAKRGPAAPPPPGESVGVLPQRVDNSATIHSRPVFSQGGSGSCGSASRIGYLFTHEINAYRNLDGSKLENQYPTFFTWLLTGQGSEKEQMAIFNGIPNAAVFGGNQISSIFHQKHIANLSWPTHSGGEEYGWMQGYDRWKNAAGNRLEKVIDIQIDSREKIEYLKWWFYNHHGDSTFQVGGIIGGGVASGGWGETKIPAGSPRAGEWIISKFGSTVDHGVVWAGYDDTVEYDLNGDGQISEDEKGAIIMLNSWGPDWANSGTIYIPYKLLIDNGRWAEFYYIRKDYEPQLMMKIEMSYSERNQLKLAIGVADDNQAEAPDRLVTAHHFQYAGNSRIPMLGRWDDGNIHNEPMEFGFDLTDLSFGLDLSQPQRYFLVVETAAGSNGVGKIESIELLGYQKGDSTLLGALQSGVELSGGGKRWNIPIDLSGFSDFISDYIYIPQRRLLVERFSSQQNSSNEAAVNVLDGDPATIWHTQYSNPSLPHQITIAIDSNYLVSGLEYLPRQTGANGTVGQYQIFVSMDADSIGTLVAEGEWEMSQAVKRAFFEPMEGRFVTFRAVTAMGNYMSAAEINLLTSRAKSEEVTVVVADGAALSSVRMELLGSAIRVAPLSGKATLRLFSVTGQLEAVASSSGLGELQFELSKPLRPGVYWAEVSVGTSREVQKLVAP